MTFLNVNTLIDEWNHFLPPWNSTPQNTQRRGHPDSQRTLSLVNSVDVLFPAKKWRHPENICDMIYLGGNASKVAPVKVEPKDPWDTTENEHVLLPIWATKKTLITFHYTGWFIGILIMAYYNPYIIG